MKVAKIEELLDSITRFSHKKKVFWPIMHIEFAIVVNFVKCLCKFIQIE